MTNLQIALTGMTGFIGRAAGATLQASGNSVQGLVRPGRADSVEDLGLRTITGTLQDRECHATLLEGADVLVHNAVDWSLLKQGQLAEHLDVNLCAGIELIDAAARAGCRIVLISSVAVHQHMLKRWNGHIYHMHPSRPGSAYGALKVALEAHCWAVHTEHGTPVTILRPSAVYGLDPKPKRSIGWTMIKHLLADKPFDRKGGGKFVHVDDVAACIGAAAASQHSGVRIHHLVDCYARWSDWTALAIKALGRDTVVKHESPPQPANMFTTQDVDDALGVAMNRGHEGIAKHIGNMISAQRGSP
jgi:nucleoside-diphosphate-sugar epimerase